MSMAYLQMWFAFAFLINLSIASIFLPSELQALNDFYIALNGTDWHWLSELRAGKKWHFDNISTANISTTNPCKEGWQGITCLCDNANCQVFALNLKYYNLRGTLPTSIASFKILAILTLSNNNVFGPLPTTLSEMTNLRTLSLSSNPMTGSFEELTNMSCLTSIDISFTAFRGSVSKNVSKFQNLVTFTASSTSMSGTLPAELFLMTSLAKLDLSFNKFAGLIDASISNLTNLEYLDLTSNNIFGRIPSRWGNITRLQLLGLGLNHITGDLPSTLGTLTSLVSLNLDDNSLSGSIPTSWCNLNRLMVLSLSHNRIRGQLPTCLGILTQLIDLLIYDNSLTSSIPLSFSKLVNLRNAVLQSNQLTGDPWPVMMPSQHTALATLDLSNNRFSGRIPSSVFLLPRIRDVLLINNCFEGRLPDTLCAPNATLVTLGLDGIGTNCRTKTFFGNAYISEEFITGKVPSCLFQMPHLATLHLSGNGLTGTLPALPLTSSLRNLGLSHNRFASTIPTEFQQYPNYVELDLSRNRFRGNVQGMASLHLSPADPKGNHTKVALSINRLSGPIPGSFHDAVNIAVVSGNMFGCSNFEEFPVNDEGTPYAVCGSYFTNVGLYEAALAIGVAMLLMLVYLLLGLHCRSTDNDERPTVNDVNDGNARKKCVGLGLGKCWQRICAHIKSKDIFVWYRIASDIRANPRADIYLRDTKIMLDLLHDFRMMFSVLALFMVCLCLPTYVIFQSLDQGKYSTHEFQYVWKLSVGYLQEIEPTFALVVLVTLSVVISTFFILRIDDKEVNSYLVLCLDRQPTSNRVTSTASVRSWNRLSMISEHSGRSLVSVEEEEELDPSLAHEAVASDDANADVDSLETNEHRPETPTGRSSKGTEHIHTVNDYSDFDDLADTTENISLTSLSHTDSGVSVTMSGPQSGSSLLSHQQSDVSDNHDPQQSCCNENGGRSGVFRSYVKIYFFIPLVNFAIVGCVNAMFLWIILYFDVKYNGYAQAMLVTANIAWNSFTLPFVIQSMKTHRPLFVEKLVLLTVLLTINSVLIPVLASTLYTADCLYEMIDPPPPVAVSYAYNVCKQYPSYSQPNGTQQWDCLRPIFLPLTITYSPPFMYSYQCTSSILENYIPVFLETYAALALLYPTTAILLAHLRALLASLKARWEPLLASPPPSISSISSSSLAFTSVQNRESESKNSSVSSCKTSLVHLFIHVLESFQNLSILPRIFRGAEIVERSDAIVLFRLFEPGVIFAHMINQLTVCMTFGLAFPLLGVVIAFCVCSKTFTWQIVIGRYLTQSLSFPPEEQTLMRAQLESSCRGVSHRLFRHTYKVVILIQALAFTACAHDFIYANSNDGSLMEWVWVPIWLGVAPLVIWTLFHRLPRSRAPSPDPTPSAFQPEDIRDSFSSDYRASMLHDIQERLAESIVSRSAAAERWEVASNGSARSTVSSSHSLGLSGHIGGHGQEYDFMRNRSVYNSQFFSRDRDSERLMWKAAAMKSVAPAGSRVPAVYSPLLAPDDSDEKGNTLKRTGGVGDEEAPPQATPNSSPHGGPGTPSGAPKEDSFSSMFRGSSPLVYYLRESERERRLDLGSIPSFNAVGRDESDVGRMSTGARRRSQSSPLVPNKSVTRHSNVHI